MKKRFGKFADLLMTMFIFSPAFIFALGVTIPQFIPDGVDKFQGAERRIAKERLEQTNQFYTGIDSINDLGIYKRRVINVVEEKKPEIGMYSHCSKFYKVTITHLGLFGIPQKSGDVNACLY